MPQSLANFGLGDGALKMHLTATQFTRCGLKVEIAPLSPLRCIESSKELVCWLKF
jgi:hypothetical protein